MRSTATQDKRQRWRNPVTGHFLPLAGLALLVAAGCTPLGSTSVEPVAILPAVEQIPGLDFDPASSLISRARPAPQDVLDDLNALAVGNQANCVAYQPDNRQFALVEECLGKLPPLHQRLLQQRLSGIFFVDGFLPGGCACSVSLPPKSYLYIACSRQALEVSLTDWLGFQEESCFTRGDPWRRITIDCGPDAPAFLYLLLRESTRLLAEAERPTPADFATGVWDTRIRPVAECDFAARKDIRFFGARGGPILDSDKSNEVYAALAQTPFVSLYGAQNADTDLAEYVTFYHLTQKLNLPYRITVRNEYSKKLFFEYEPMKTPAVIKRFGAMAPFYAEDGGK